MKKKLNKSIYFALAVTIIGGMLIAGGTYALFTSTALNTANSFTSGTLAISLDKPDGAKYFDITNIAPGDAASNTVTVKNDGSLGLRYDIAESLTGALTEGDNPLAVTIKDSEGNTIVPGSDNNRILDAGDSETLTVSWQLPLAAGNDYQAKSGVLSMTVNAEQVKNN
jgi:predicted ribosomally synthesized peptide with SipW-like signal peptide